MLCSTHYFTTAKMVDERGSMLRYTYTAVFVYYNICSLFHDAVSTSSSRVIGKQETEKHLEGNGCGIIAVD